MVTSPFDRELSPVEPVESDSPDLSGVLPAGAREARDLAREEAKSEVKLAAEKKLGRMVARSGRRKGIEPVMIMSAVSIVVQEK